VTEPGGTLILATPNLDSLLKPWKGLGCSPAKNPSTAQRATKSILPSLLRKTGSRYLRFCLTILPHEFATY